MVENKLVFERISEKDDIFMLLNIFKDTLKSLNQGDEKQMEIAEKLSRFACVIALKCEGDTLAFAAFYANDSATQIAYISFIAVLPECQGKGYGGMVFSEIEKISKQCGMKKLRLEVNKSNVSAQKLYQKRGMSYESKASADNIYMSKEI